MPRPRCCLAVNDEPVNGGEGGIRTPGTLIRGTHDFQSCTFNHSVTSPCWNFKHLRALPCFSNRQCLQNFSIGRVEAFLERTTRTNLGQRRIAEREMSWEVSLARYTIETPVIKKNLSPLGYLHRYVSTMSPHREAKDRMSYKKIRAERTSCLSAPREDGWLRSEIPTSL